MHGLLEPEALAKLPGVAGWLAHAGEVLPRVQAPGPAAEERLRRAVGENVLVQLEHLGTHPAVRPALEARTPPLHGWVCHLEQGRVG
jgi:carbonic anhydrase